MSGRLRIAPALAALALGLTGWLQADAQTSVGPAQPLITRPINEANLTTLAGNTRPEARNPANDRGASPTMPLPTCIAIAAPGSAGTGLQTLIDQLHDPKSPNYHHWLPRRNRRTVRTGAVRHRGRHRLAAQQGFTVNAV